MPNLDELLNEATSRARQIADGGDPYDLGEQIFLLTMDRFDDEATCVASPLSSIFGHLIDLLDRTGYEPRFLPRKRRSGSLPGTGSRL